MPGAKNSECQEPEGRGHGEMVFNGYKASVLQSEL